MISLEELARGLAQLTLTDLATLAYLGVLALIGSWVASADRQWRQRAAARGLMDFAPGGGVQPAAFASAWEEIAYLVRTMLVVRRLQAVADREDTDPATEAWRVRMHRRLHVLAVVALAGLSLPAASIIVPMAVSALPLGTAVITAIFAIGLTTIYGSAVFQFARRAIAYGNGEPLSLRHVIGQAVGIVFVLAVFVLFAAWRGA